MAWVPFVTAASSIIGDFMAADSQDRTNAMSTANMLQQEQWQTAMSNTAMQRRVKDLEAAGLNPLLATGTSGAQVGSVGTPNLQNPGQSFGGLGGQITGAMQLYQQQSQ